jgi:hypothetical protein
LRSCDLCILRTLPLRMNRRSISRFSLLTNSIILPFHPCLQYFAHEFGFSEYLEASSSSGDFSEYFLSTSFIPKCPPVQRRRCCSCRRARCQHLRRPVSQPPHLHALPSTQSQRMYCTSYINCSVQNFRTATELTLFPVLQLCRPWALP